MFTKIFKFLENFIIYVVVPPLCIFFVCSLFFVWFRNFGLPEKVSIELSQISVFLIVSSFYIKETIIEYKKLLKKDRKKYLTE